MLLRFRLDKTARSGIRVTKRFCNIACTWCHHDYFQHDGYIAISNTDFSTAIQRVIDATSATEAHVRLAGDGDPTIVGATELGDLITILKKIPQIKKIKMTTNGILLGGMAQELKEAGIDSITISLNSLTKSNYIKYAQYDGLHFVLESLQKAFEVGINLKINTIYCQWNENEINAFEELSIQYNGMCIKVFDLLTSSDEDKELYRPLDDLEDKLKQKAISVTEEAWPYAKRSYVLSSGARFDVKISGHVNNCPNNNCKVRDICLEGCRHSIRIGLNGTMQPCGVRTDNIIDLLDTSTTPQAIRQALHSGGKYGYNFTPLNAVG